MPSVVMLSVMAPRTGLRLPAIYPLKHQLREGFLITVIMLSVVMLSVMALRTRHGVLNGSSR
jgi:hypothetical protein